MDENNHLLAQRLMPNDYFFKKKKEVKYINVPSAVEYQPRNLGGSIFACGLSKSQKAKFDEKEKDKSARAKWSEVHDGSCTRYSNTSPLYSGKLVKIEKQYVCTPVPLFCYTFNMSNYQSPMLIFNIDSPPPAEIPRIAYGKLSNVKSSTRASGLDSRLRSGKKCTNYWKKSATDVKNRNVCGETSALDVGKHENFDDDHQRSYISQIWSDQNNPIRNVEFYKYIPAQYLKSADENSKICNIPRNLSFAAPNAENPSKSSSIEDILLSEKTRSLFHNLYGSRKDAETQKMNFETINESKQVERGLPYTTTEHEFGSVGKATYKPENSYIRQEDAANFVDEIVKMRTDVDSIFESERQLSTSNHRLNKTVFDSTSILTDIRTPEEKGENMKKRQWTNPYYDGRYNDYDKVFPIFLRRTMFPLWNRLSGFQVQSEASSYYTLFGTSSGIELSKIVANSNLIKNSNCSKLKKNCPVKFVL